MPLETHFLPTYRAKQVRQNGRSYVQDSQGMCLPSVTTILNATKPQADRERLMRWRDRLGHPQAQQVTTTASRRGTLTHTCLKRYLLGQSVSCPTAAEPYWTSLQPVLDQLQTVRLVEGYVFHYDLGYAGKVDCIASYKGAPCLIDWKTADQPKGSWERLYDQPLQLVAYCGAANHSYAEQGLFLQHAALVVALPNQPAEVFWLEPDLILQYWRQWQDRLAAFYKRGDPRFGNIFNA